MSLYNENFMLMITNKQNKMKMKYRLFDIIFMLVECQSIHPAVCVSQKLIILLFALIMDVLLKLN